MSLFHNCCNLAEQTGDHLGKSGLCAARHFRKLSSFRVTIRILT